VEYKAVVELLLNQLDEISGGYGRSFFI